MNLYEILKISHNASQDDVKKAYRKLAKEYHPDMNPNNKQAEVKFTEIGKAYEVLGDVIKRKEYDLKNTTTQSNSNKRAQTNKQTEKPFDFSMSGKAFENFFGFDSKTGEITNEQKLKNKNPLDTSDLFESFMKMKK